MSQCPNVYLSGKSKEVIRQSPPLAEHFRTHQMKKGEKTLIRNEDIGPTFVHFVSMADCVSGIDLFPSIRKNFTPLTQVVV